MSGIRCPHDPLRIYPIALFSFDAPQKAAQDTYTVEFPDRKVLEFSFAAIQLNRLASRDYLHRADPVAAALMAKMKIAPKDCPRVKAECLRLLVTLQLDPAKTRLISKFVDTYLRLDVQEERTFEAEIDKLELRQKEAIMQVTTSWQEKGMEKATRTIARNLRQRHMPVAAIAEVTGLTLEQLEQLQPVSGTNQ